MNTVSRTQTSLAVERYKTEIIRFMIANPETAAKKGRPDSVDITEVGRLLCGLSQAGSAGGREIIANLLAGRPDENLGNFLQACCLIYGCDFSNSTFRYDRYGRAVYGEAYRALKKYLSTFADYLLDDAEGQSEKDEPGSGLMDFLRKRLKKLREYFGI